MHIYLYTYIYIYMDYVVYECSYINNLIVSIKSNKLTI